MADGRVSLNSGLYAVGEEATMAAKDKGGKNKKQAATRTLKEKRQAKRDKRGAKANPTIGTSRP